MGSLPATCRVEFRGGQRLETVWQTAWGQQDIDLESDIRLTRDLDSASKDHYGERSGTGQEYPGTNCCRFIRFRGARSISSAQSVKMNLFQFEKVIT